MRPVLTLVLVCVVVFPSASQSQHADSLWMEFTGALFRGEITAERIHPHHPSLAEPLLGFLDTLRQRVPAEQWRQRPEAHRVGNLIHYIIPFREGVDTSVFCFTIEDEADRWYFVHLENIFIRLDTVSRPPVSSFPDLPDAKKAWMREEKYWSFIAYLHGVLSKEKGSEYVLNLLKDGQGYFLEAKTWVPFVPARRAFILYACWEQSTLRGNRVTLEELTDNGARVSLAPIFLQLYKHTAHLKNQIAFSEYRRIFETIWYDRANAAGWKLDIQYPDDETCVLTFR